MATELTTLTADDGHSIGVFTSEANFVSAQRMAQALAKSSMVPAEYRNNVANCVVAMELANRTGASVLAVMQSVDIIHGRPAWRATFKIGAVNSGGRFEPLRYERVGEPGADSYGYYAWTTPVGSDARLEGPVITWELVKAEGWDRKSGSKWRTMPEKMFRYRAGSWWVDLFAPEIALGMTGDADELREQPRPAGSTYNATVTTVDEPDDQAQARGASLLAAVQGEVIDTETGEVLPPETLFEEREPGSDDDKGDA